MSRRMLAAMPALAQPPFLDHPQQLGLHAEGHVANFIEE